MNFFDFGSFKNSRSSFAKEKQPPKTEEEQAWDLSQQLLTSLSFSPKKQRDPDVFLRAVSSIAKMKNDGELNDEEADVLLKFAAAKYIEILFDSVLESAFDHEFSLTDFSKKSSHGKFKYFR